MRLLLTLVTLSVALVAVTIVKAQKYPNYANHFTYVPHEKVDEIIKRTGFAGRPPGIGMNELIPMDNDLGVRSSVGKRAVTPPTDAAEVHGAFGHTWLILEGEGTLVQGGQLVDPKDLGNGNWGG